MKKMLYLCTNKLQQHLNKQSYEQKRNQNGKRIND